MPIPLPDTRCVDKRSNELFGKDFVVASPAQQLTLLLAMDDAVSAERSRRPRHPSDSSDERDTQLKGSFFSIFKNITLHGYYTSEIGFTQELKLQIIPGAQHGCLQVGPGLGDA